jgi:hypothetical protein
MAIVFTKLYPDSWLYAINRTRVSDIHISVDLMTIYNVSKWLVGKRIQRKIFHSCSKREQIKQYIK